MSYQFPDLIMIRFPPTSIALSESDIEFHLRDIRIKEHLYAQGFTRKEVQRYCEEHHGSTDCLDSMDDGILSNQRSTVNSQLGSKEPSAESVKELGLAVDVLQPFGISWSLSDIHSV